MFRGCLAVTRRLLYVNVLKTQGAGVGGGSTLRSGVRQGSALRSDRYAARKERAALTDASAAGVAGEEHVCSSVLKRTGVRLRSGRAAWEGPAAAQWEVDTIPKPDDLAEAVATAKPNGDRAQNE